MNLYQPTISGSLTVSGSVSVIGPFTMSGGSITGTASFASNSGLLSNLDSGSFVGTGSFNSMSSSVSTRVSKIEGNYATTGSNIFTGAQTVCANITSTGTIIAQTLNVQQVTSSIVYSSGSNTFGCDLANVQQFTGSVNITGSLSNTGCTILNNPVLIKYPNTDVNAIQICATTGTNASAMVFSNSGGNFYVGKDNSTGGRIVLSAVPYANAIWAENCCAISFGVGNVERLRINCSDIINIGSITSTNNKTIQFQVDTSLSYSGRIQMSNDTSILYLNGGGNLGYNFGASIELVGKDRYACCHGGQLTLRAGNSVNCSSFGYIGFETCNAERMRVTFGGDVVIGKTATDNATVGIELRNIGLGIFARCAGTPFIIRRICSVGELLRFDCNTVQIGTIQTDGTSLQIGGGSTGAMSITSTGITTFCCQVCSPRLVLEQDSNSEVQFLTLNNKNCTGASVAARMDIGNWINQYSLTLGRNGICTTGTRFGDNQANTTFIFDNAVSSCGMYIGLATSTGNLNLITAGTKRLTIDVNGITCFVCQVCAPSIITTGANSSVRGGDPAFFRGSTVTQSGNSITFDAFRFLNPTGGLGGSASAISGRLYMTFQDTNTGGNQVSYEYLIFTTGNGVSPGPYCFVQLYCGPVRGTNPISAISLVNDGSGGAVKVQATTAAATVGGAVAYITYVGTAV